MLSKNAQGKNTLSKKNFVFNKPEQCPSVDLAYYCLYLGKEPGFSLFLLLVLEAWSFLPALASALNSCFSSSELSASSSATYSSTVTHPCSDLSATLMSLCHSLIISSPSFRIFLAFSVSSGVSSRAPKTDTSFSCTSTLNSC